jgi:molybdopterin synthase sulfur carrier subunit
MVPGIGTLDWEKSEMAVVNFTPNLQRHITVPCVVVEASDVKGALDVVFAANPRLRGYVLDDRGGLRKHMAVFVDGETIRDRDDLSDVIQAQSEVFVMQALSGG